MIPLKKVQKGQTPTLLEAEKANELITAINSLLKMKIVRGENDEFLVSEQNSILTLKESGGSIQFYPKALIEGKSPLVLSGL